MKQCENGHFYDEKRFDSCPYCKNAGAVSHTVAAKGLSTPIGGTVALKETPGLADRGKTVGIIKKNIGIDPAVGFVVCIKGPMRGADFALRSGRNFIGRAASMDVALADDETVSRENHALITYDDKHNAFMLTAGSGRGITYKNDEQIESAAPLAAYDRIEIGESVLIFLPLCSDRFTWEDEK